MEFEVVCQSIYLETCSDSMSGFEKLKKLDNDIFSCQFMQQSYKRFYFYGKS